MTVLLQLGLFGGGAELNGNAGLRRPLLWRDLIRCSSAGISGSRPNPKDQ